MKVGLLWYDNSRRELATKVGNAAQGYRKRFGQEPNVCYVHPAVLPEGEQQVRDILVRPASHVLKHHFWVGREQSGEEN